MGTLGPEDLEEVTAVAVEGQEATEGEERRELKNAQLGGEEAAVALKAQASRPDEQHEPQWAAGGSGPSGALAAVATSEVGEAVPCWYQGLFECTVDMVELIVESTETLMRALAPAVPVKPRAGDTAETSAEEPPTPPDTPAADTPAELTASLLRILMPGYFEGSAMMKLMCAECAGFSLSLLVGSSQLMPSLCSLYLLGAAWPPAIAAGAAWRLVAPIFLHVGLPHLVSNLIFQGRFGFAVERHLGSQRLLMLYLLSGAFGNLISAAMDPYKLAVGASTSCLGLVGARFVLALQHPEQHSPEQRRSILCIAIILGAVFLASPSTDVWGHLGGLVGGACLMELLSPRRPGDTGDEFARHAAAAVLAVVGFGAYVDLAGLQMPPDISEPSCPPLLGLL